MKLEYLPHRGFILNSLFIGWNDKRENVREILQNKHQEQDIIVEASESFEGDVDENIHQKRDIYQYSDSDLLFLNYDIEDRLCEIEVHFGYDIFVDNIRLFLGKDISKSLECLKEKDSCFEELEKGSFLFNKLNMLLADSKSIGGEGASLAYFYATSNIGHLKE